MQLEQRESSAQGSVRLLQETETNLLWGNERVRFQDIILTNKKCISQGFRKYLNAAHLISW